jgi:hypothetical protein
LQVTASIPEIAPKLPAKRNVPKVENVATVATVATDFKEDPFQNYRYEDPFMIADPFQDEDENENEKKNDSGK